MSWARLTEIIKAEMGADAADRIQSRILTELAGTRIRVPKNKSAQVRLSPDLVRCALKTSGYSVERAAEKLGCTPARLYRYLGRKPKELQISLPREFLVR
jgi:hypothetical protein